MSKNHEMSEQRLYFKVLEMQLLASTGIILIVLSLGIVAVSDASALGLVTGGFGLGWGLMAIADAKARQNRGFLRRVSERSMGEYNSPPLDDYKYQYGVKNDE